MPTTRPARPYSGSRLRPSRLCFFAASALLLALLGWPVLARSGAASCEDAARSAAARHGVPPDILHRLALLETGRSQDGRLRPWPWALNAGGDSHWLADKPQALARARAILATGRRNLDLGCFQLNYHWHAGQFDTLDSMLDPAQNADYAARFLKAQFRRLGDWTAAVGAYHSRNPDHAARYLARYAALGRDTGTFPAAPTPHDARNPTPTGSRTQTNRYALLTGGDGGARGSLVPASVLAGSMSGTLSGTLSASGPLLPNAGRRP